LIKKQSPNDVLLILKGEQFMDIGNNIFRLDTASEKDYDQFLNVLKQKDFVPDLIIQKWSGGSSAGRIDSLYNQINDSLYSLFNITKSIMNFNLENKLKIFCLYYESNESIQPHYAALSGFLRSIMQENQKISTKLIAINEALNSTSKANHSDQQLLDMIYNESVSEDKNEFEIRYENWSKRFARYLEKTNEDKIINTYPSGQKPVSFKKKGVYLITGGIDGVGLIFAKYLANTYKAKLVLCGRSDLSHEKENKIRDLRSLGAEVFYQKADVSRQEDVKTLIAASKAEYKQINGIIHSAGIVQDANIQNKTHQQIEAVIAPKVWGTIHLDKATKDEDLDCFIIFSSVVALMGNIGQTDYAYANSFIDQFALTRENMVKKNMRKGKTISINWPIWREGGMKVEDFIKNYLKKKYGLISIEKEDGIAVLETAIKSRRVQTALLKGDKVKMNNFLESFFYVDYEADESKQSPSRNLLTKIVREEQADPTIDFLGEKEMKQSLVSMIEKLNSDYGLTL
jgi:short-subunit dehydrogenase